MKKEPNQSPEPTLTIRPFSRATSQFGPGSSSSQRFISILITVGLGYFLVMQARSIWTNYWLLRDGQPGVAVVTKELWSGHDAVGYRYTVDQKEYTGSSYRNWQNEKYRKVRVGENSVVYFSSSHPWLSLLYTPRTVVEGLPVLIIALLLELLGVVTIVSPKSRWAFDLSKKQRTKNA